ncbi:hypothetical protein PFLUV_G00189910 [Perca fluviatilis]|uniref:Fibronectin type-III domain-containing protein n=1 Tax=Perca fluviatilis TaxID=8168 RepID=A0A6A5DUX0_PERFL|nr:hypothetical protein PFLUV_G00189910 [Perca fluviatilis]
MTTSSAAVTKTLELPVLQNKGHVFAKETPDVDCLVVHLKYVHCSWNKKGTPEVNYTFYGWFHGANVSECPSYLSENNINTGCNQPYGSLLNRFNDFYTRLVHENQSSEVKKHELKEKVKFNPPTNLTVHYGSDSNLWLNWTQIRSNCVESEVRYRINNGTGSSSRVSIGKQDYCLNLPSQVPYVDCLVVHLKYVHCSWNKKGTPEVNYTFYGWFHGANVSECPSYLSENNINTGCNQPYGSLLNRFNDFYTRLVHENQSSEVKKHELKEKVKFNPPTNLTVHYGSDSNLWLNWTQIRSNCVESEVRYRINNGNWASSRVSIGKQDYCLNLPSRSSLYELQVRSRMGYTCGLSKFWSDWTEPVVWGSNNSMGMKEGLNYNERPCPVREYCHVRQSDSESSDCSTCSVTTDQTDCSVFIPVNESDQSTPCSSSISQF